MIKTRISKNISCISCSAKHLCLGKDLTSPSFSHLDQLIKNVKLVAKKDHIYHMNHPLTSLYAVHQGSCKEYWIDENGNECITNFYFPGDIIGIESVSKQKYMFYTTALEDMELCIIPINDFLESMHAFPEILKRFLAITNQKMQHDHSTRTGITANEKVSDFLLNIARRMHERNPGEKEICLTMSQVDIANFLGIAAETINRIFNTLKRKKIIKLKSKKFEVLNIAELQKLGRLDYTKIY